MVEVRYVQDEDKEFWFGLDQHLSKDEFEKKVRDRMGYILLEDGKPKGILRYHLFWDQIPFCTLLYIGKDFRNRGFGKQLVQHWEEDMKSQGHGAVLTSAQADETAQHFYRKLGYRDCGGLTLPVPGYEQPPSCFSSKQFNKPGRGEAPCQCGTLFADAGGAVRVVCTVTFIRVMPRGISIPIRL